MYIIFRTLGSIKQSNARPQTWVSDSDDRVQLMYKSFHTWMSHTTRMNLSYRTCGSCHTYEWFMSHTDSAWMNNDNETYKHEWVTLYTHINESRCTCEWGVMSGRWVISHIAYHCDSFMDELSCTYPYAFDVRSMQARCHSINRCCSYYFERNSLVAFLETLCA